MTYDPTFEVDHAEDCAQSEETARLYLELESRLPRTKYREQLQRVSSQRLIKWWHRIGYTWSDCARMIDKTHGYMRFQFKELQTDTDLWMIDIEETLKARGYVNIDEEWYTSDGAIYQRWHDSLSDRQLKREYELSEWDARRDER